MLVLVTVKAVVVAAEMAMIKIDDMRRRDLDDAADDLDTTTPLGRFILLPFFVLRVMPVED